MGWGAGSTRRGKTRGLGRLRAGAGGRCAPPAARPAASLPPAVERDGGGGGTRSPRGERGWGPGRAGGSAVRGAAGAAEEPGAAPARRACVCERACVRGGLEPGEGAGGVSLRRGLRKARRARRARRARAARAADRPRPRPLTHAALRPPPGRGPRRGRRAAAGGGVCAHTAAHRHTPAAPQTHATHRAAAGAPSPPGTARIAQRSHSHSP